LLPPSGRAADRRAGTIYALASAMPVQRAGSGIAVIRLSGAAVREALLRLTGAGEALPVPRQAALRLFRHPLSGEPIDRGLLLWFPGPASFTGEDCAEFHVHGGRAVITAMLEALAAIEGCRLAAPGEFARRSFEHGKLDLTAVEAIADLVAAETAAQRRQALRQLEGELGRLYDGWRSRLLRALAHLEAELDFADEDLPSDVAERVLPELAGLRNEIGMHLADRRGERLREGYCIAIVGPPNVGKSSLLNRLARREAAIVSPVPGTTRDLVEVHLDLGGYPVLVVDTAGLRDSTDPVEQEGVRRAQRRAREADLRLLVLAADPSGAPPDWAAALTLVDGNDASHPAADIGVLNKADLLPERAAERLTAAGAAGGLDVVATSARSGAGIDGLVGRLRAAIESAAGDAQPASWTEMPPLTQHRHREALGRCVAALDRALAAAGAAAALELVAEDARIAAREIGRITGRVDVEDILDIVFRDFCIGK
jgi:tRNA modification GTPase